VDVPPSDDQRKTDARNRELACLRREEYLAREREYALEREENFKREMEEEAERKKIVAGLTRVLNAMFYRRRKFDKNFVVSISTECETHDGYCSDRDNERTECVDARVDLQRRFNNVYDDADNQPFRDSIEEKEAGSRFLNVDNIDKDDHILSVMLKEYFLNVDVHDWTRDNTLAEWDPFQEYCGIDHKCNQTILPHHHRLVDIFGATRHAEMFSKRLRYKRNFRTTYAGDEEDV